MTAPRQPRDLLAAHIAINLTPNLSANARRVAAALLEHWNHRTGRCDPGVERLSTMLAIDRATVLRATAELCGAVGLFRKQSHGGRRNTASYQPMWDRFEAIVADFQARMASGSAPEKVAKLRRSRSQDCDVDGRKTATQTHRRNPPKEPMPVETPEQSGPVRGLSVASAARATDESAAPDQKPPPKRNRRKGREEDRAQRWLLLPIVGQASHADSARSAAERRIEREIRERYPGLYPAVVEAVTPAMMAEAADAEIRQRGSGAASLIRAVEADREPAKRESG